MAGALDSQGYSVDPREHYDFEETHSGPQALPIDDGNPPKKSKVKNVKKEKPTKEVLSAPADTVRAEPVEQESTTAEETKPTVAAEDKPNIIIIGESGSGKSRSLKGLDPERTIILSTEMKKLPFRGANKFKMQKKVTSFSSYEKLFDRALNSPNADVIVTDSFTSLVEFGYNELIKPFPKKERRDEWQTYRDRIHDLLVKSKQSSKYIVFIAVQGEEVDKTTGQRQLYANVQGQLRNTIEKEFTCVFWTKIIEPDIPDGTPSQHVFVTNKLDGNKAKTPEEMFPLFIPNDLANALSWMDAYYDDDAEYEYTGPVITTSNDEGDLPE